MIRQNNLREEAARVVREIIRDKITAPQVVCKSKSSPEFPAYAIVSGFPACHVDVQLM